MLIFKAALVDSKNKNNELKISMVPIKLMHIKLEFIIKVETK